MTERDLWFEARLTTMAQQPTVEEKLQSIILSLPGRPARETYAFQSLAGPGSIVVVDLNKYRPGANLKAFKEEGGVEHLILRMGGPAQFYFDNWKLTEDTTYRLYFNQARALGYKSVGGYVVYSAGIDAANYEASEVLLNFANEVMGRDFIPDYIAADDEVNQWTENGRVVTATGVNHVKGLKVLLVKFWQKFRLAPMHYSARWFMDKVGKDLYVAMLDSLNAQATSANNYELKQVLNWYAWYLSMVQNSNKLYQNAGQLLADLPVPTQANENAYLNCGSHSLFDLHQCTSNWVTPYCLNAAKVPIGVDASVTRYGEAVWMRMINKAVVEPEPEPEPTPELAIRVKALEDWAKAVDLTPFPLP